MRKVIQCVFDSEEHSQVFVRILTKIKDEKMESLTSLDTSMLENAVEKSLVSVEEIN
jgi:uncharacterized membrane protein YqhA